jgi:hypothetical protein
LRFHAIAIHYYEDDPQKVQFASSCNCYQLLWGSSCQKPLCTRSKHMILFSTNWMMKATRHWRYALQIGLWAISMNLSQNWVWKSTMKCWWWYQFFVHQSLLKTLIQIYYLHLKFASPIKLASRFLIFSRANNIQL